MSFIPAYSGRRPVLRLSWKSRQVEKGKTRRTSQAPQHSRARAGVQGPSRFACKETGPHLMFPCDSAQLNAEWLSAKEVQAPQQALIRRRRIDRPRFVHEQTPTAGPSQMDEFVLNSIFARLARERRQVEYTKLGEPL